MRRAAGGQRVADAAGALGLRDRRRGRRAAGAARAARPLRRSADAVRQPLRPALHRRGSGARPGRAAGRSDARGTRAGRPRAGRGRRRRDRGIHGATRLHGRHGDAGLPDRRSLGWGRCYAAAGAGAGLASRRAGQHRRGGRHRRPRIGAVGRHRPGHRAGCAGDGSRAGRQPRPAGPRRRGGRPAGRAADPERALDVEDATDEAAAQAELFAAWLIDFAELSQALGTAAAAGRRQPVAATRPA